MNPLAALSGGFSSSVSSKSGDASGGLDSSMPFQYNASFQVGGSGSQSQSQAASQTPTSGSNSINPLYLLAGAGALALLGIFYVIAKK